MFPIRDNIPSRRFPFVNYFLIVVNIVIFIHEVKLAQAGVLDVFISQHALIPFEFLRAPLAHIPSIFLSMFLHGGWVHVLSNMWFLFVFGDNVEDALGHVRYLIYYLLVGIGAAAVQIYMSPTSHLPMVGASGAIAGILGGYIILYPGARVLTFFVLIFFVRFVEIPAFFYLGLWFLTQTLNG